MIPTISREDAARLKLANVNERAEQAIESLGIEPIAELEDEYGTHKLYSSDEVFAALESVCVYAHRRRDGFSAFAANVGIEGDEDDDDAEGDADEAEGDEED